MTGPAPSEGSLAAGRAVGVVEQVAPGVARILAPNPGIMTGAGTNTYLLGDGPTAVIDPGPDDDDHLRAILEAVGGQLSHIIATHTHTDHSPLARRLQDATNAEVLGFGPAPSPPTGHAGPKGSGLHSPHSPHSPADAHDMNFAPDRRLADGDRVRVGPLDLVALHTPGHCSNHLCIELAGSGLLFSGDHVMSGSTVVVAPPDGDMAEYMEALERVRDCRPTRIAPGHGEMIDDPAAVLDGYLAHRRTRERQVLAGVRGAGTDGVTSEALVGRLYSDVPAALHPVARYSVWAHLRKLGAEGTLVGDDPDDVGALWRTAPAGT